MKACYDNVIASGKVRRDIRPPDEMAAVESLDAISQQGRLIIVTSRQSWREQEGTRDPVTRTKLAQARHGLPVLANDHVVLECRNQGDVYGGFIAHALVSDIVDEQLLAALLGAGLEHDDAHHLMYAVHNGCDFFVSLDPHFVGRKLSLEPICRGLRIVKPSELVAVVAAS